VQRGEGQQAGGLCDPVGVDPVLQVEQHQVMQRLDHGPAQTLALQLDPVFECAAVRQVKAVQEVAMIEIERVRERPGFVVWENRLASLRDASQRDQALELGHIEPHRRLAQQRDRVPRRMDIRRQHLAQVAETRAQIGQRLDLRAFGPEQFGEHLAWVRAAGAGEVHQQCFHLARVKPGDRSPVVFEGQPTEGVDAQQVIHAVNLPQSQMSGSQTFFDVGTIPKRSRNAQSSMIRANRMSRIQRRQAPTTHARRQRPSRQ